MMRAQLLQKKSEILRGEDAKLALVIISYIFEKSWGLLPPLLQAVGTSKSIFAPSLFFFR